MKLRLSEGLRERLKRLASENGRSLNAEIISRLERSFFFDDDDNKVARLAARYEELERMAYDAERAARIPTAPINPDAKSTGLGQFVELPAEFFEKLSRDIEKNLSEVIEEVIDNSINAKMRQYGVVSDKENTPREEPSPRPPRKIKL